MTLYYFSVRLSYNLSSRWIGFSVYGNSRESAYEVLEYYLKTAHPHCFAKIFCDPRPLLGRSYELVNNPLKF